MNPVAPVSATFMVGKPPVWTVRTTHRPRRARQSCPHRGRRWPGPGAWWSGVDWSAGPGVEAQRLHDEERGGGGEDLDVGGGEHAGVLGDDGRGGAAGDGVEVCFDPA